MFHPGSLVMYALLMPLNGLQQEKIINTNINIINTNLSSISPHMM